MSNGVDAGEEQKDPRKKDYAIVVGVSRYPKLTREGGTPADLDGPINDALKVREWLGRDDGGGVPLENVEYVVRQPVTPAVAPDPTRDTIVQAFAQMYARCWQPNGAPIVPLGRRLYVYVSGHGVAGLDHGALLCSNSSNALYASVGPHLSIGAFRQGGFFKEFVVWFDGCMDWAGLEPEPINYNPKPGNSLEPPGPVFTAYAAHPRLRTVEAPDLDGEVHGIFTQTLLRGLEGGAADPGTGVIDGFSLQNYLVNTLPKYLPDNVKNNILVDKQPFVRTDPGIVFGTAKKVPLSTIVLQFGGQYDGAEARVWRRKPGDAGLSLMYSQAITNGAAKFTLTNGIYAVDVPQHGLRTGFEVTGGTATKLAAA